MSEENPIAGGSYLRNSDGTLKKQEQAPAPAEKPAAPAEPATTKGAK